MEASSKTDAHTDNFHSLHPFQFCRLCRLDLQQNEDSQTLILKLEHETEARRLMLRFEGVIGLEFSPNGFQPVPLYLEIAWIGDRQWQGINYQVFNTEQDVALSFHCREFQVDVEEPE